jgi:hypothetical protein
LIGRSDLSKGFPTATTTPVRGGIFKGGRTVDNTTVKTDNLIDNLRETLRNLRRLSDALYAIADNLEGDTPPKEKAPSGEDESAITLSVITKVYSEDLLLNAERIGSMIGYRGTQPPAPPVL